MIFQPGVTCPERSTSNPVRDCSPVRMDAPGTSGSATATFVFTMSKSASVACS